VFVSSFTLLCVCVFRPLFSSDPHRFALALFFPRSSSEQKPLLASGLFPSLFFPYDSFQAVRPSFTMDPFRFTKGVFLLSTRALDLHFSHMTTPQNLLSPRTDGYLTFLSEKPPYPSGPGPPLFFLISPTFPTVDPAPFGP